MVKQYGQLLRETRARLRPTEGELAAQTARELLAMASGKTVAALLTDQELYASEPIEARLGDLTARYLAGCPLAYLLGQWDFRGLTLTVTPDVLIPRDDTLAVTELAIERLQGREGPLRVLDLCTGSGCIGLAIADAVPNARVTLGDVSPAALRVAKQNISDLGFSTRVTAFELDVLKPAPAFLGQFDVLVSNPPYITKAEMPELEPSVRDFEPHLALDGGEDGLVFYRSVLQNWKSVLKDGGWIIFEVGEGQAADVRALLLEAGFHNLGCTLDTLGTERVIYAQKKKPIPTDSEEM